MNQATFFWCANLVCLFPNPFVPLFGDIFNLKVSVIVQIDLFVDGVVVVKVLMSRYVSTYCVVVAAVVEALLFWLK